MSNPAHAHLSRRERQIMDIVYRLGAASAGDIRSGLADAPTYSTVRALLRILETKGHLRHERKGVRYVYRPTLAPETARRSALRHIVQTFFDGSVEQAAVALLDQPDTALSHASLDRLSRLIEEARGRGHRHERVAANHEREPT